MRASLVGGIAFALALAYIGVSANSAPLSRDLTHSLADTSGDLGGWTYPQFNAYRNAHSVDEYEGFGCIDDCEGHSAGFLWAKENRIGDVLDCDGDSWSFIEGCAAYVDRLDVSEEVPEIGLF